MEITKNGNKEMVSSETNNQLEVFETCTENVEKIQNFQIMETNESTSNLKNNVILSIENSTNPTKIEPVYGPSEKDLEKSQKNNEEIDETMETSDELEPIYIFSEKGFKQLATIQLPVDKNQNYLRGCKWSPDGTCLLSVINNKGMIVNELPVDLYQCKKIDLNRSTSNIVPVINIPENGLVYDFNWFPNMSSMDPNTCCWASTGQHGPIHLWDAFTGELRSSYRGFDAVDELEAALSVNFSFDGHNIYGGYKKSLKQFDITLPGRDYVEYKLKHSIVNIETSFSRPDLIALGSWNKTILLASHQQETIQTLKTIHGHSGGINLLKFSLDGQRLYSGARRDRELICWDLRKLGKPLFTVERDSYTNQKIFFDITNKWLVSGQTTGFLKVWNVENAQNVSQPLSIKLNEDCLNSVSLHPYLPILATGSGQHHYFNRIDIEDDDDNDEFKIDLGKYQNLLNIWWLGDQL